LTTAETLSKSFISSTLTKAAIFGADAQLGPRAVRHGYSGIEFDPEKVSVSFQSAAGLIAVCQNGRGLAFDEALAKKNPHRARYYDCNQYRLRQRRMHLLGLRYHI
jgi:glutamate N-acetyltransferase/amino-acid N-acetyltransferase